MPHKLTCLVGTYNEAARLPAFLQHATQWADEIVIVDKCSTDDTAMIAHRWGEATDEPGSAAPGKARGDARPTVPARFHTVAYTPQGHEDKIEQFQFCNTDWVFLMTPGEVPTRELIAAVKRAIAEHGDTVDIITVPKKLYSFGIHNPASPWSIGQQPMVVNRKRAVISNQVHRNFSLRPGGKAINIPYSETCHVFHPTHATVASFLRSHFDYILAEVEGCANPDALMAEAQQQIVSQKFGGNIPELFGQQCAWKLYWLGCMLAATEKKAARDVPAQYATQTAAILASEWGGKS